MNFTREPIIETIITPKEGYKLIVRSSTSNAQEEYIVDAVEVVSFGHSFFFRSLERPKPFFVPVSYYEIIETKETRVVLKNASFERAIKIGGGREANVKAVKEKISVEVEEQEPAVVVEQKLEKKRERRRHRRRRGTEEEKEVEEGKVHKEKTTEEGNAADEETKVSPAIFSRLIPPPSRLISDKIFQEKAQRAATPEGDVLPQPIKEESLPSSEAKEESFEKEKKEEKRFFESEGDDMQRVVLEPLSTSTSFSALENRGLFSPFEKNW